MEPSIRLTTSFEELQDVQRKVMRSYPGISGSTKTTRIGQGQLWQ